MAKRTSDKVQKGSVKNVVSSNSVQDLYGYESRLPRIMNPERQLSLDERSFADLSSLGLSPHPPSRADNSYRVFDHVYSPSRRSGINTPTSSFGGLDMGLEPHPMIFEAWENLRRSLVSFRGQPVGTIAALDNNSDEKLNYDQVKSLTADSCQ